MRTLNKLHAFMYDTKDWRQLHCKKPLHCNLFFTKFPYHKHILQKYFTIIYITYYLSATSSTAAVNTLQFIKLIHKTNTLIFKLEKKIQKRQYHSQIPQPFCTLFKSLLSSASWISTKQRIFLFESSSWLSILVNHVYPTINRIILNKMWGIASSYFQNLEKPMA